VPHEKRGASPWSFYERKAGAGRRPEYKVFSVSAGDRVDNIFNAVAREGFQYAGSAQRYGHTEFIFVKWVPVGPIPPEEVS
jgi:hypothetical protein